MKKIKKYKKANLDSNVTEPPAVYEVAKEKHLVFFNSFNEMNESDLMEMAEYSAKERFEHITFTLQNLYVDVIKTKSTDKTLHFK